MTNLIFKDSDSILDIEEFRSDTSYSNKRVAIAGALGKQTSLRAGLFMATLYDIYDSLMQTENFDKFLNIYQTDLHNTGIYKKYRRRYNCDVCDEDSDESICWYARVEMHSIIDKIDFNACLKINDQHDDSNLIPLLESAVEHDNLFGILLTDGNGNYMNPGHPLVAKYLKKHGVNYFFPHGFKIIMYIIKLDDDSFAFADRYPNLDLSMNLDEIEPIEHRTSVVDRMPNPYNMMLMSGRMTINVADDVIMRNDTRNLKRTIVVPVHVMQYKGIAYPWYGLATKESNGAVEFAVDHGPMYTGNIGTYVCRRDEHDSDEWEEIANDIVYPLCTGVRPVGILDSFGTLNVNNYDSSYHKYACDINPIDIKKAMIKEALAILKS